MPAFLLRRLLATIPVLIVVALIVFTMLQLSPGDPAAAIVGDSGNSEDIARVRAQLGLDQPWPVQFANWSGRLLQGDLGTSLFIKKSVAELISQRVGPTLSLAAVTLTLTLLVAIPLGVLAAWRHGGWLDRALMSMSALGFSVPAFVVAYLLIWLFALHLKWLPVQGYVEMSKGLWPWLRNLILPAFTLSTVYIALIARVTRASVAEALTEDYIRTARSKGISEARVLARHALRNAAIPIATVVGIGVALLISGVVVTETVFAIPGLGQLTVDAVLSRDFPVIQGITLFFSVIYVMVNLLVDLSYLALDPRIRY
ncbi:ABC transporter permease [Pigmentiphaga aceris]|uniref:ABC transporter permease n=1 Tax=Pigmentiphaga aceris TaxID=1940612 RepID=A0A5C0B5G2_9BURK|nr:ABC transporter permease [Pigmentiphaga aceris]QEI07787.1 ABC transporter permease [Pigmentiphaga aceris]